MQNNNLKNKFSSYKYYIYGLHSVAAAINNPYRKLKKLFITTKSYNKLIKEFKKNTLKTKNGLTQLKKLEKTGKLIKSELKKIKSLLGENITHQGIALKTETLIKYNIKQLIKKIKLDTNTNRPIVILDQINDPHNVGAILRTSAAFNAHALIITSTYSPSESGIIAKISSGGLEKTTIITVNNLMSTINELKNIGIFCIGLDSQAKDNFIDLITQKNIKINRKAIILGSENKGLRKKIADSCDKIVKLNMPGEMQSINVSNVAAIVLHTLMSKYIPYET